MAENQCMYCQSTDTRQCSALNADEWVCQDHHSSAHIIPMLEKAIRDDDASPLDVAVIYRYLTKVDNVPQEMLAELMKDQQLSLELSENLTPGDVSYGMKKATDKYLEDGVIAMSMNDLESLPALLSVLGSMRSRPSFESSFGGDDYGMGSLLALLSMSGGMRHSKTVFEFELVPDNYQNAEEAIAAIKTAMEDQGVSKDDQRDSLRRMRGRIEQIYADR